ncbi:MAG: RidA family protein [Phycisphaerales bacterium]|nr:RidA family protein [Phycisphaerae bacterium]NNM27649.1 RidA family protein [Phycisphaerales bacterium]
MERTNISTGTPWEEAVGYSRAVRVGPFVHVTGTIAAGEDGKIIGAGEPYVQTKAAIEKIQRALESAGASLADVVRTRLYVTNLDQWERIGAAHREFFGDTRPCTTMVEVSRLFAGALVEIEAEAIVSE